MDSPKIIGTLIDKYEEEVTIHKTRHGMRRLRGKETPVLKMNRIVGALVCAKIKAARKGSGLSLRDLGEMLGCGTNAKQRAYALENNGRGEGLRLGTLFMLVGNLGGSVTDFLPSMLEVSEAMGKNELDEDA
jgi:hypothetical protein